MTDQPADAQRVAGRGKLLVALVVLAVVAAIVVWVLGRGDRRSAPLEDAGRALTPAFGGPAETAPPAGDTGRNAPADSAMAGRP